MEVSGLNPTSVRSKELQKAYQEWFAVADSDGDGHLTKNDAMKFFSTSNLSQPVLTLVWALVDSKRQGFLGLSEFISAMQLISLAQDGHQISSALLKDTTKCENLPEVEGFDAFIMKQSKENPISTGTSLVLHVPSSVPSKELEKTYQQWFVIANSDADGCLTRKDAIKLFSLSNLSQPELNLVWVLADSKGQGFLRLSEFITAMQLISLTQVAHQTSSALLSNTECENLPEMEGLEAFMKQNKENPESLGKKQQLKRKACELELLCNKKFKSETSTEEIWYNEDLVSDDNDDHHYTYNHDVSVSDDDDHYTDDHDDTYEDPEVVALLKYNRETWDEEAGVYRQPEHRKFPFY